MAVDPYVGDIRSLGAQQYRRRVGDYRIVFELYVPFRFVEVLRVERRTSTTYRKHR